MPSFITLDKLRHPRHTMMALEWEKFRLAFEGGILFKRKYLKKFSNRETDAEFQLRRLCSHVPAHAKAAILNIRNAVFSRMIDITRVGGHDSYQNAILGLSHGVDGKGNTMNSFLGQVILPELLVIGRVGIYIDKPQLWTEGASLAEAGNVSPYLYHYQAEDIFSWHYNEQNQLDAVLLRDHAFTVNEDTGLIDGELERFRLLKLVDGKVELTLFGLVQRGPGAASIGPVPGPVPHLKMIEEPIVLDLPEIPFVLMELDNSLMADIADYQISLLNLASSDINYALKSNFPFYTEQFAPEMEMPHIRPAGDDGTAGDAATANRKKVDIGVATGRRYPRGLDRPGFIHPSSEPIRASMALQEKLKAEINQLVNLSLQNIQPVRASAESKTVDNQGLEGGLANIGLELEYGERNIGRIWWKYQGQDREVTVKYPSSYSLRTDEDRRREAAELQKIAPTVPSKTFQKQTMKDITLILQGHKVSQDELQEMYSEIDESEVIVTDPETIKTDHEAGFVSTKLASELRGYPEGEAEQAAKDHAERAARIVAAQTNTSMTRMQARGGADMDSVEDSGHEERTEVNDTTNQVTSADRTRGEGQDGS